MSWTVEEHAAHIRALVAPVLGRVQSVPLVDALHRTLAVPVVSPVDLPLFRNSQMDGFAVRAADLTPDIVLPVVATIAAGPATPDPLAPGTAVRIMTGAVVPEGADAVVPVEDTTATDDAVTIRVSRAAGEFVREAASDLAAGAELVPAGLVLESRHLAALAAAGVTRVEVVARVRVAVITTGSELIDPGERPTLGQVFDSNAVALRSAVAAAGGVVGSHHRVTDDGAAMLAVLRAAAAASDLIVTSGGISAGDFEVVREVLEPLGARVGHVAMQPGGPQATAVFEGTPVVCFPGNPVSTQLSFELFLAPLLRGTATVPVPRMLLGGVRSVAGKRQYLRGRILGDDRVSIVAGPGSHLVAALAASDVLVVIPEHVTELPEGATVETIDL